VLQLRLQDAGQPDGIGTRLHNFVNTLLISRHRHRDDARKKADVLDHRYATATAL